MSDAGVRKIAVRSPSAAREAGITALACAQIVFWSGVAIAALSSGGGDDPAASLQADEIAFGKLDTAEQRVYRRALEGLGDAEDTRSRTGKWPTVDELVTRRIPPFATDPIDRAGYRWQLVHDKYIYNYVGIPDATDRPTIVIVAIEPEPGAAENVPVDETHHRLGDNTAIHVGVWRGTARTFQTPLAQFPFLDGWRRIAGTK